jgi:hypothetical protein
MINKSTLRILFILSGALFVALAYILRLWEFTMASEIIKDFAVVLLSIVFLDMIWSAVGGDFSQGRFSNSLIDNVYLNPQEAERENSWREIISNTRQRIDLQGLSLSYFTLNDEFMSILKERILSGVKVRVVIMSPDNPFLGDTAALRGLLYPEKVVLVSKQSAEALEMLQDELKSIKTNRGGLTVVINKTRPMSMSIRRFDNKLFVLPYIWNRSTFNSPVYFIQGEAKELFRKYIESFEDQFDQLQKL